MTEVITPQGELSGLCGHDGNGWEKVKINASKQLEVDVKAAVAPTGVATAAKQDTLINNLPYAAVGPTVYNKTMTSADTEYSQALPDNTKKFMIKCRGEYALKVCFVSEGSGSLYLTVPSGQCYWEDLIRDVALTLYFQCATAGQVAEIVAWA